MSVGESYKRAQIDENYDTVVIGSGIGGLAAAALLSKEGQKVLVLERHYVAGGFTHVFKRKEYEWDVGLHYIGEVHDDRTIISHLFKYITNDTLKWQEMGEVYDRIIFGDKEYQFVKGTTNWLDRMKKDFPNDHEALDRYINLIYQSAKTSRTYFQEKTLSFPFNYIAGSFMRKNFLKFSRSTTYDVLKTLTDNEKLIGVLCGQYGDYGLPPKQSSFAMHAMLVKHYLKGGAYPIGGSGKIAECIEPVIQESGGKVLVSAEVDKILVENKKAQGVQMIDGRKIMAKSVISGAGFFETYNRLIPESALSEENSKAISSTAKPSVAHVCLYIGLKGTDKELGLTKANYWIYPDEYDHDKSVDIYLKDPDNSPLPVTYISFPSAKDPDWQNRYPGKSTIEIITLAPYEWFKKWENERWKKRGDEYEAYKEKFSQRLLKNLYKVEPQLEGKIDYYELSTPLSTKHFVNYQFGEIYGLEHDTQRFDNKNLKPYTPVKNLWLTGQDIVSAGIGGALFGGVLTTSTMLKKNLLGKVIKQNNSRAEKV